MTEHIAENVRGTGASAAKDESAERVVLRPQAMPMQHRHRVLRLIERRAALHDVREIDGMLVVTVDTWTGANRARSELEREGFIVQHGPDCSLYVEESF